MDELQDVDLSKLTEAEKIDLLNLLEAKAKYLDETKLERYAPYKKQLAFHVAGGNPTIRERLLMAGNQLGKTWAAAFETAYHLTGLYPDNWDGAWFDSPTSAWAASLTSQGTRDTVQRLLLGPPGKWGTGAIPKDKLVEVKRAAHGVADSVETIVVRHKGGGESRITLKTYDQGRERWQGETLDFVWFDEEPPADLYFEGLTRTNATNGIVYVTFTPLLGMSAVVKRFLIEKVAGTSVTTMTIEDAEHYTPEQRKAIIAAYPEHERKARAHGIPMMGSGMIFPIAEEAYTCAAFPIPYYWPRIVGIDFGWDHPFAAAWLAIDPDSDVIYVYHCYRQRETTPAIHTAAIRPHGTWIPVAWPHDGNQHDKGSGEALAKQYRDQGLNLLKDKATHPPQPGKEEGTGGNSVEAGLLEILQRMQTGRFKVFSHLADWFEEARLYHRKDGKIVKENDDIISATRYATMMKRFATVKAPETFANQMAPRVVLDAVAGY